MAIGNKRAYESLGESYAHSPGASKPGQWSKTVRDFLGSDGGGHILDIGCGTGISSIPLAESATTIVAVDNAVGMLQVARRRCREQGIENTFFVVADAEALPFRDGSFDTTASRLTLHHTCMNVSLSELRRVTTPGGKALVADVVNPKPWEESLPRYVAHALARTMRLACRGRLRESWQCLKLWSSRSWARHMLVENNKLQSEDFAAVCSRVLPGVEIENAGGDRRLLRWRQPVRGVTAAGNASTGGSRDAAGGTR